MPRDNCNTRSELRPTTSVHDSKFERQKGKRPTNPPISKVNRNDLTNGDLSGNIVKCLGVARNENKDKENVELDVDELYLNKGTISKIEQKKFDPNRFSLIYSKEDFYVM